ncbi:MAG: ABC transporter ATP-binding protein [Ilumatobacteraceae bacterium]|jgi:ABC-2 type transport system ATP-binding protein|nr:ABC transporter ATP-binding protein [Ilumatobacteraceae bacterium]
MATRVGPRVALDVRHLRKCYGSVVAVEDVSFGVRQGEIFGILGPNGSGKTTTVECLQGLRRADAGEIDVLGLDPRTEAGRLRQRIGAQLQESALPDRIKVWEALHFFSSLAPGGPDWRDVMERWDLGGLRNRAFSTLSGGQQQRLLVALAVVNGPELVFLDEMTTGLDPSSRRVVWQLVRDLRDQGTTVVMVTHFMDEAEHLCDRIAVIHGGRVAALGTTAELIAEFAGRSEVTFSTDLADIDFVRHVDGVATVEQDGTRVIVRGTGPVLARVAAALVAHGDAPIDLEIRRGSLEDAFLAITGDGSAT